MNQIAEFIKKNRKAAGLTQEQFAMRAGLGLRFVRELEQGKETVRMDKVNIALGMFGMEQFREGRLIRYGYDFSNGICICAECICRNATGNR